MQAVARGKKREKKGEKPGEAPDQAHPAAYTFGLVGCLFVWWEGVL